MPGAPYIPIAKARGFTALFGNITLFSDQDIKATCNFPRDSCIHSFSQEVVFKGKWSVLHGELYKYNLKWHMPACQKQNCGQNVNAGLQTYWSQSNNNF